MKKVVLYIIAIIVVAILGIGIYVKYGLPNVGNVTDLKITLTPERIERGAYLANHVSVCMDCHSERNWSVFSAPIVPGTLGEGGEYFGPEMGFPGKFYSRNITPVHLGNWTDGEIFRAITTGVNKNGEALFPVMPYSNYGKMDKEDVYDIIAYIRTLPAINKDIPKRTIDFPMNFIINTIPQKAEMLTKPSESDTVNYGHYLVQIAACRDCHTQVNKGQIILEKAFAGGREFKMPNGVLHSANLTSDKETGLGNWTEAVFLSKFEQYSNPLNLPKVKEGQVNTIMPWAMYAGMKISDLKAIFAYLKTLKPIKNEVVYFSK